MGQLGYPTTIEKFTKRFNTIITDQSYQTLVAEWKGDIVGMVGIRTGLFYEYDGSYVQIAAFVVDKRFRGKGIGEQLIKEIEFRANQHGAKYIVLNSGNRKEREEAHRFYMKMGFEANSIGFSKKLD
ncbi:GNAT family N-acetyltransferase [Gracilibacillus sp. HCP3S3_G5_1]|uniref:GNAT family N-acetyltransferase n=1 Tax=unclassified Gracilibacillus TaxID=2625209 RepID=UPI003F8969DC